MYADKPRPAVAIKEIIRCMEKIPLICYDYIMESNVIKKELEINGALYEYFSTRAYTPIDVYRGADAFLRIGPAQLIDTEIAMHQNLEKLDFPLAPILGDGEFEERRYFIEKSLGDTHYGDLFAKDVSAHFDEWLRFVKSYADIQIKTARTNTGFKEFEKTIHFEDILSELPDMNDHLIKAMAKIESKLSSRPFVMSHNDLTPNNIFPDGIIDFERARYSPVGYDLATNIFHIFLHPTGGEYEFKRKYEFSKKQVAFYLESFPEIKNITGELFLCRAIWSTVRMHRWPKIQKWRYDFLKKILLDIDDFLGDPQRFIMEQTV